MPNICVHNTSTLVSDADVVKWIAAIQKQVSEDFAPIWGVDARLYFGDTEELGGTPYRLILKDQPDDPNDLGFHLLDNNIPEARIFVAPTLNVGESVSSVMSHEVLEFLADPSANQMAPDGIHILEVCDPVQSSKYNKDNVEVSNFVTPGYFKFSSWASSMMYDFLKLLAGPVDMLLPGSYIMALVNDQWQSKFARLADGSISASALHHAAKNGRSSWRAAQGYP